MENDIWKMLSSSLRNIAHSKPISSAIVHLQPSKHFVDVEGAGAATSKDRDLISAFVYGTVTI